MGGGGTSETGGGGSVYWKVDGGDVRDGKTQSRRTIGEKWLQEGTDEDGEIGTDFTVSIKAPNNMPADVFLRNLRDALAIDPSPESGAARVYFNIPIEKEDHRQIRISWGDQNLDHRGNGGRPTRFPAV